MIACQRHNKGLHIARNSIRTYQCRYSTWLSRASDEHNSVQAYVSSSRNPYLNLSIEHALLQKTPKDSRVLFLYVNRPCVVIGRNQNPWLETNLNLLGKQDDANHAAVGNDSATASVDLVRRRSGGGTVFHDEGNVNWTVISPSADFTRDKHAEMVVKALRHFGIEKARVNERHDIVLDQGQQRQEGDPYDYHRTPFTANVPIEGSSLKVSGSAFKLTRGRALHHGTCLLRSANLESISKYLRSPARPYIQAKGVDSVRSPVANIDIGQQDFKDVVLNAFKELYPSEGSFGILEIGSKEALEEEAVSKGFDELQSLEWMFRQTPGFRFSASPSLGAGTRPIISLEFRNCEVVNSEVNLAENAAAEDILDNNSLQGSVLYEDWGWNEKFTASEDDEALNRLSSWLSHVLPTGRTLPKPFNDSSM